MKSMKGKGQYIYISVAASEAALDRSARPLVMFNDGHEGGSPSELFNDVNKAHPKGVCVGLFESTVAPALKKLLQ